MPHNPAKEMLSRRHDESSRSRSRSRVRSPINPHRGDYRPRNPSPLKKSAYRGSSVTFVTSDYPNDSDEECGRREELKSDITQSPTPSYGMDNPGERPLPSLNDVRRIRQASRERYPLRPTPATPAKPTFVLKQPNILSSSQTPPGRSGPSLSSSPNNPGANRPSLSSSPGKSPRSKRRVIIPERLAIRTNPDGTTSGWTCPRNQDGDYILPQQLLMEEGIVIHMAASDTAAVKFIDMQ